MKKFILVASELDGHACASGIIASNADTEQKFRNEFLLLNGKYNAELISRDREGTTVVEYYTEIEHFLGNFSISTTPFNSLVEIQNKTIETRTG